MLSSEIRKNAIVLQRTISLETKTNKILVFMQGINDCCQNIQFFDRNGIACVQEKPLNELRVNTVTFVLIQVLW